MWDVFLSYNTQDKATVRKLAWRLKEHGLRVWFDEWELVPGRPWQQALEEMIENTKSVAVLVGSEGIGPWQQTEMRASLTEFVHRGLPVIPVLLPHAPTRIDLPIFLRTFTWVDLRDDAPGNGFDGLMWGITGSRPREGILEFPSGKSEYRPEIVGFKLHDVFKTVGLPSYTYIEPTIYRRFMHAMEIPGQHLVLEGSSGVGKTCMVFRALRELGYKSDTDYEYVSVRDNQGADRVISLATGTDPNPGTKVIIVDDVHMLMPDVRSRLANRLKLLSDAVFRETSPSKFVLVGIPTAAATLLFGITDLWPRLSTHKLGDASERQLRELIYEGEQRLAIRFQDADSIVAESNGSFHLCQYICREICFNEGVLEIQPEVKVLRFRIDDVRRRLLDELHERYGQQILAFCKGYDWKVSDISGFMALLASLARRDKAVVNLNELLVDAGPYAELVQTALEMLAKPSSGPAFERLATLVHYDSLIKTFSIEDPSFRYYLRYFDIRCVLSDLGIADHDFESYYRVTDFGGDTTNRTGPTPQLVTEPTRDTVFISYSHADLKWLDRLRVHLAAFLPKGIVSFWSDTQIRAGGDWVAEIDRAIDAARVAVLLVSANYLASDFITDTELPSLLAQARKRGLRIIWVPVSPCFWQGTAIASYQSAIDPSRTLAELTAAERENSLVRVSQAIHDALIRN